MSIDLLLISDVKIIITEARNKAYRAVNSAMIEAYWKIGRRIVQEEQKGQKRAEYGSFLIKNLSSQLTQELGQGFSVVNLKSFRKFYLTFLETEKGHTVRTQLQSTENEGIEKGHTVCAFSEHHAEEEFPTSICRDLTWSHYRLIMRVENAKAREFYINEASKANWSCRSLERNINTFYYERILSTSKKEKGLISTPNVENHNPVDFIKDPYIFEFLNIPQPHEINERDLETALINNLQQFLLELGKGFSFIGRQYRISTESKSFYIDLVFYNYVLKCFVLFDLKSGELTHQDIGQMDMYVRMFDDLERKSSDNSTIGIILCTSKDATIVKYSMLNGSEQIFAPNYKMYLPTEEELIAEIERGKLSIQKKIESKNI